MEIKELFENEIKFQCGMFKWVKDIEVRNCVLLNNEISKNLVEIYFKGQYVITLIKEDSKSVGIILTAYFWGLRDEANYKLYEEMKKQ